MPKLTGIVQIKIDGKLTLSLPGASLDTGGPERTFHAGHKVYGNSNKILPSTVSFTTAHAAGDDIIATHQDEDKVLEFDSDNGESFIVNNASSTKPPKLTDDGGGVEWEYMGDPAESTT